MRNIILSVLAATGVCQWLEDDQTVSTTSTTIEITIDREVTDAWVDSYMEQWEQMAEEWEEAVFSTGSWEDLFWEGYDLAQRASELEAQMWEEAVDYFWENAIVDGEPLSRDDTNVTTMVSKPIKISTIFQKEFVEQALVKTFGERAESSVVFINDDFMGSGEKLVNMEKRINEA